ncbi:MAG: alpha/beta hydrolase [Terracidiphilus sp.]|jgi:pimeloyl-ACP methyl ester carboxylesterase
MPTALLEPAALAIAAASVRSADGTRIGFSRFGEGPAVVYVHGSVSTHTDWMPVAKLLSRRFSCFVIDRRGRGKSGLGNSPYSIDRECEDIAAVAAVAESSVALVGHSYGAICVLEAAMRIPVRRLAVYEPPLPVGGPIAGEYLEPYAQAIAANNLDLALEIGLKRFTRLSAPAIEKLRASRAWSRLRTLAPSWTRELEVMDSISPGVERYRAIACPILLLAGAESPEHPMKDATRALTETLPGIQTGILPGQGHMAMRTAPALLASLIGRFLSA